MTREEQLEAIAAVLRGESFAVFSFAGAGVGDPPYSSVMFFAETGPARLAFGTSPGAAKGPYLRTGNGACAQVDTRAVGLANMSQFARVTIQGRLRRVDAEAERAAVVATYTAKLPNAGVFVSRPGVEIFLLEPSFAVCARGLLERFEIDFPAGAAPG
jgi:nitroimidazol reductase NimA-like FMN-containing flavoprotein (pyridoxamine 5'-phosphate oxidase superfamily)